VREICNRDCASAALHFKLLQDLLDVSGDRLGTDHKATRDLIWLDSVCKK